MQYDFDTVINRVGTRCAKHDGMNKTYGKEMLHLGVADMDFRSPEPILNALRKVVDHGVFGYIRMPENYGSLIKEWMIRRYGCFMEEEWSLFCSRINIASSLAVDTLTKEGEGVILHTPAYTPLRDAIEKNQRQLIESKLVLKDGTFKMDFEKLEKQMNKSVRMFILCSPHNPTGRVWTKEELEEVAIFCNKHQLILLVDEIHADFIAPGYHYTSMLNVSSELNKRLVVCHAITKTFNVPGVMMANMIIPNEEIRSKMREAIERIGIGEINAFAAAIIEPAYTACEDWLAQVNAYIHNNYQWVQSYFEHYMPLFKMLPHQGTYLAWVDCNEFNISEDNLKNFFINEAEVSVYMGSQFSLQDECYIRINLATSREYLADALQRIRDKYHLLES